ncbi:MAG: hypothetical protein ACK5NN_15475 [Sphingomonadaceae bacterium]
MREFEFNLSDRHRSEVARIFGQSLDDETGTCPAVVLVVDNVKLFKIMTMEPESPETTARKAAAGEAARRQKKRANKILTATRNLMQLLDDSVNEPDEKTDYRNIRATFQGCFALAEHPDLDVRFFDITTPEMIDVLSDYKRIEYEKLCAKLESLEDAAANWLDSLSSEKRGAKKSSELDHLIYSLEDACQNIQYQDLNLYPGWQEKPAAPSGPLCRLLGVVVEAIWDKELSGLPQRVRKAMERRALKNMEREDLKKRWMTCIEPKKDQ